MAEMCDEGGDPLLTLDVVRDFMLSKGGKIHNHELISHFKNFVHDPQRKGANRLKLKAYVNTLSVVKLDTNGEKIMTLKKKYRDSGNFDVCALQTDEAGKKDSAIQPAKDAEKSSDNLTESTVKCEGSEDYVLITKEEKSNSVEGLDVIGIEHKETNEFISSELSDEIEIFKGDGNLPSKEEPTMFVQPELLTDALKQDLTVPEPVITKDLTLQEEPSAVSKDETDNVSRQFANKLETPKSLNSTSEEQSLGVVSVKEAARNLNKLESDSQGRAPVFKNKRENRKPASAADDASGDYVTTFSETDRQWLLLSANSDYMAMMKMLQNNPQLARQKDFITGYAPLHWAAKHGKEEVVKLLCGYKVPVNVRTQGGYTPLHLSAMNNHERVVDLLVNVYGADSNIRDYSGKTAKQCMQRGASNRMHQMLQPRRTANLNATNSSNFLTKAMFMPISAVGGLRTSWSGKEDAGVSPSEPKFTSQHDCTALMPPPSELPTVLRNKPVKRQKDVHSDSEMAGSVSDTELHGCDSSPNFGTIV